MIDWVKAIEPFPHDVQGGYWKPLFDEEGFEIRGEPMRLDWRKYGQLGTRLVFVTARLPLGDPIGYAAGYVFNDLHWGERVANDDIWFVRPQYRRQGIGQILKETLHEELKKRGATKVYELTRNEYYHPCLMADMLFTAWGVRWVRGL